MKNRVKLLKRTCLLLVLVLTVGLFPLPTLAESESGEQKNGDWVNFLLMCNEGMNNSGGNAGNTMMIVAMDPVRGHIRLMMLTWDTFVHYQGYDVLQRMDMPYRKGGPEETLKVFKDNFHIDVDLFMSLNYLNLATMIDRFFLRKIQSGIYHSLGSGKCMLPVCIKDHSISESLLPGSLETLPEGIALAAVPGVRNHKIGIGPTGCLQAGIGRAIIHGDDTVTRFLYAGYDCPYSLAVVIERHYETQGQTSHGIN